MHQLAESDPQSDVSALIGIMHYFVEFTNPDISFEERLQQLIDESNHLIRSLEMTAPFIIRAHIPRF